jgi:hypothetical protein
MISGGWTSSSAGRTAWEGFSTGHWEGNMLSRSKRRISRGYLQLNGIYLSDQATLVEHFVRHGNT